MSKTPLSPEEALRGIMVQFEDIDTQLDEETGYLTLLIDPGDAPSELITEFYLKLDALYCSLGGKGLKIVSEDEVNEEDS